jgi:hypothetical protein
MVAGMEDGPAKVALWLEEIGVERDRLSDREWTLRVPSARREVVAVALTCRERSIALRAFFLRGPDRNHEAVYRRLLRKHLDTEAWRFAVDDAGDLWLCAEMPLEGARTADLDGLLGLLSTSVDETFESTVRTGFEVPEGMRVSGRPPGVD